MFCLCYFFLSFVLEFVKKQYGTKIITNHTTGDTCEVTFHAYSFFSGSVGDVDGVVKVTIERK
jgi:hypothetical protein